MDTLNQLESILQARRSAAAEDSYVASLYAGGLDRILKKVGEENAETIIAAMNVGNGGDRDALVGEVADLWFHCMVMLCHLDIPHSAVMEELDRRFGTSGHVEKAARAAQTGASLNTADNSNRGDSP